MANRAQNNNRIGICSGQQRCTVVANKDVVANRDVEAYTDVVANRDVHLYTVQ